ncbi:hypothetical protein OH77DRAFT_1422458 [Trametes cingulata]|nr:hypothetical protein OH77DRAFT_1422458 [Trametes cingulata]
MYVLHVICHCLCLPRVRWRSAVPLRKTPVPARSTRHCISPGVLATTQAPSADRPIRSSPSPDHAVGIGHVGGSRCIIVQRPVPRPPMHSLLGRCPPPPAQPSRLSRNDRARAALLSQGAPSDSLPRSRPPDALQCNHDEFVAASKVCADLCRSY